MDKTWTVGEILAWTKDYFASHGLDNPRLEAEVLLAFVLGLTRVGLYVQHDRPVNLDERKRFRELIIKRIKGEPTAYLVKSKEFMSLPFYVDRRVLIPRPDTEILVEESIRLLREKEGDVLVADVGCGSGAIGISIAKYVPNATVFLIDLVKEALEVARINAEMNQVMSRVVFVKGDLLTTCGDAVFDLIAANLPYIPQDQLLDLPHHIRDYEPLSALNGGKEGVDLYLRLLPQAYERLKAEGYLLMEVMDKKQAELLLKRADSGWETFYIKKDLAQRDRVLVLRKAGEYGGNKNENSAG